MRVKDSGIGIPPEEQEQLFDRFFRGTSAEDNVIQGVGLGLTIAQAIAEAHGGEITVESTEGAGSTFSVELPSDGGLNEVVTEGAPRYELAAPTGAPQGWQRLAGVDQGV